MSIEEIMELELDGLNSTINDYCKENYIRSYTKKLMTMHYPEDQDNIVKLTERILVWYRETYPKIEESRFITNKYEHKKSIEILETILELLGKE